MSPRLTPVERVMRRAMVVVQPLQRVSVQAWMLQPVLPMQRTRVERDSHTEHHGPMVRTERVLQVRERLQQTTLRERLLQHTVTLLTRHASVAPVARAMKQSQPVSVERAETPTWAAARTVAPVHTTVLSPGGRNQAAEARRPPTPASREPAAQRPPALPGLAAQPLVLPPQEMSRVTDHVMQQLDKRLLSYRERTGQV